MADVKYWVGFNLVPGIGPMKVRALLDHFGDLEEAWRAEADELRRVGLDRRARQSLLQVRSEVSLEEELDRIRNEGAKLLTWDDPAYPSHLRNIYSSPPLLYIKGELLPQDEWAVAVVGTRRATVYGKEATRQLVGDLVRNGVTIVSGLARGIDSKAHQAALEGGGRTIAVLGCGIDIIYPQQNLKLAQAIIENGALVTEYPLGTPPEGSNFPPRNRIISGLSLGTLVVEAGVGSGALISADFALEQGREVFAVPGNMFNRGSKGTNRLIQQGAKLVLSVEDILEELNLTMVTQQMEVREIVPENEMESRLLEYLSAEPVHVDELGQQSGLPIATVSSTLAMMELKGMVRQVGGMNYILARESRVEYVVD
ncbi:MAG: DNA-processing protein DprA [Anaerolineae bacterium]